MPLSEIALEEAVFPDDSLRKMLSVGGEGYRRHRLDLNDQGAGTLWASGVRHPGPPYELEWMTGQERSKRGAPSAARHSFPVKDLEPRSSPGGEAKMLGYRSEKWASGSVWYFEGEGGNENMRPLSSIPTIRWSGQGWVCCSRRAPQACAPGRCCGPE